MKIIEDKNWLKQESDIEAYFKEDAADLFDCGQGYYQNDTTQAVKINDDYYFVKIKASIESAKQDRGDRLYWVEDIEEVTYRKAEYEEIRTECNRGDLVKIKSLEKEIAKIKEKMLV